MGLGFIVIFLLIQFIAILYWLLNYGCCAQMTCAGWVYIFGGRVKKFYVVTKCAKKIHFCLVRGFSNDSQM